MLHNIGTSHLLVKLFCALSSNHEPKYRHREHFNAPFEHFAAPRIDSCRSVFRNFPRFEHSFGRWKDSSRRLDGFEAKLDGMSAQNGRRSARIDGTSAQREGTSRSREHKSRRREQTSRSNRRNSRSNERQSRRNEAKSRRDERTTRRRGAGATQTPGVISPSRTRPRGPPCTRGRRAPRRVLHRPRCRCRRRSGYRG